MPARDRKASTVDLARGLSALPPERAGEFLAASLVADPNAGVLRLSGVPCVIVRPEAIVNIQRQLEVTIGGPSKGILYFSFERSAQDGMNPLESIVPTGAPLPWRTPGGSRMHPRSSVGDAWRFRCSIQSAADSF